MPSYEIVDLAAGIKNMIVAGFSPNEINSFIAGDYCPIINNTVQQAESYYCKTWSLV